VEVIDKGKLQIDRFFIIEQAEGLQIVIFVCCLGVEKGKKRWEMCSQN
jgi:hypothetical protein